LYTLPSMQLSISFTLLVYFYNKEKSEHQLKLHTDGKGVQKLVLQSAKGRCNCDIRGESNLHVWWIWTTGMYPSKSALASEYYTEFVCRSKTGGRSVTQENTREVSSLTRDRLDRAAIVIRCSHKYIYK
jgi:hypothetical protein